MSTAGGLVSYGVDNADLYRRAADYVDRILKSAKPIDLPVQLPTQFELAVRTSQCAQSMSALRGKADIDQHAADVAF
jgi:ABC-type uncharacterized transport system substrate-binding protein